MTTTPPSLWAVLLSSWLHSVRQPGEHGRALSTALALRVPAWAPRQSDRGRAVRWYDLVTAALERAAREMRSEERRAGTAGTHESRSRWTPQH